MTSGPDLAANLGSHVLRESGIPGFFAFILIASGVIVIVSAPEVSHFYMMPLAALMILIGLAFATIVTIRAMRRRENDY